MIQLEQPAMVDEVTMVAKEPRSVSAPRRIGTALGRFSGVGLLLIVIGVFAVWIPDTFLTSATVQLLAEGQAVTAILAVGLLFTLAAGLFDISAAQNLGLSAVVVASLISKSHLSPLEATLVTLCLGLAIGVVNGTLVAVIGVDSFVATLGMSSILLALTELISNGQFIQMPNGYTDTVTQHLAGIPLVTIVAFVLALIVWYALEHTPMGRRTYAVGANREAAKLAGVRTARYVFGGFLVSGLFASLAGVVVAAKTGSVSSTLGPPYLLPAFAACFLGTTQIKVGRFNVWGTILALYLLATGVTGLQLAGGSLWITDLFNGLALVGAVTVALVSQQRKGRRIRKQTARA